MKKRMRSELNALAVADYFLSKKKHGIDNLKLNKLVYIALGFSLAKLNLDLYPEEVEAWVYGPVIPKVYHTYKENGALVIAKPKGATPGFQDDIVKVLELVWNTYIGTRGVELISLTHREKTPWSLFYEEGKDNIIEKEIIQGYYKALLS